MDSSHSSYVSALPPPPTKAQTATPNQHRRACVVAEKPPDIRDEAVAYMSQFTPQAIVRAAEEGEGDPCLLDCLQQLLYSEAEDWVQDYVDFLKKKFKL